MQGEAQETRRQLDVTPLEIELRDALGFLANLAARVELAIDLGEIDEQATGRVSRIASHLGAAIGRIGQVASGHTETSAHNGHSANGHSNGHSSNGHSTNGYSNGHTETVRQDENRTNNGHAIPAEAEKPESLISSEQELAQVPPEIQEHFSKEEYAAFSERDIAVAIHLLQQRGRKISIKSIVDSIPHDDDIPYDTLRKGVATSITKLRETELGEKYLRDNNLNTKARRYILLPPTAEGGERAQQSFVPDGKTDSSQQPAHQETSEKDTFFAGFLPLSEQEPSGSIACKVLDKHRLQIGSQVYEYRLTGMRDGNKPTTIGVYNGLVELLVKQGKTEIKPGELTQLLGLSGTGVAGTAFDKLFKRFDHFPFIRTGIARGTTYRRNPDVYFTVDQDFDAGTTVTVQDELLPPEQGNNEVIPEAELDVLPTPEKPEYPKKLELTEWGLNTNIVQDDGGHLVLTMYLEDRPLQLRDITIQTLLAMTSSRQSMLHSDLLQSVMTLVPDMTDEKLRGCLHEIRNCFEYHDADKHLYRKQLPEHDGRQETLWNINGIIDGNGVSDFLALSSVTD